MLTKNDLIDQLADAMNISRAQAAMAIDTQARIIAGALANSEDAILPGLGRLLLRTVGVRQAKNPRTGDPIVVPARRKVVFKASSTLKNLI